MSHSQANTMTNAHGVGVLPDAELGYPEHFHRIRAKVNERFLSQDEDAIKQQVSLEGALAHTAASCNAAYMTHKDTYARFKPVNGKGRTFSMDRYASDIYNLSAVACIMHDCDMMILIAEWNPNKSITVQTPWVSPGLLQAQIQNEYKAAFETTLQQLKTRHYAQELQRLDRQRVQHEAEEEAKLELKCLASQKDEVTDLTARFYQMSRDRSPVKCPGLSFSTASTSYFNGSLSKSATTQQNETGSLMQSYHGHHYRSLSPSPSPYSPSSPSPQAQPFDRTLLAQIIAFLKRSDVKADTFGAIVAAITSSNHDMLDEVLQRCSPDVVAIIRATLDDN